MNRYPYTNGHLLVAPYRHVADFEDLDNEEGSEIFDLAALSVRVLKKVMRPDGFNIGINIGRAGGAGVCDHVHLHVVPRWSGDTNFMTTLAETRVVPEDLGKPTKLFYPTSKN